ncbi:MAG: rRNA maturation RNase YbeY [Gammaproteobacteria bacterium]
MKNTLNVDLQHNLPESPEFTGKLPTQSNIREWLNALDISGEITVRIVDKRESEALNRQYRKKEGPTNILSFPFAYPDICLGDLIICAPLVAEEAMAQHKTFEAHFVHLIIHGTLHLLGYDHGTDEEAHTMETKEIAILAQLGYRNPYE